MKGRLRGAKVTSKQALSPSQGAEQGPTDWEQLSLAQQMLLEPLGLSLWLVTTKPREATAT